MTMIITIYHDDDDKEEGKEGREGMGEGRVPAHSFVRRPFLLFFGMFYSRPDCFLNKRKNARRAPQARGAQVLAK